jgi:hypothetical protein
LSLGEFFQFIVDERDEFRAGSGLSAGSGLQEGGQIAV